MSRDAAPRPRADWCVFLDIDGTLVDLAPTPEGVRVDEGLAVMLARAAEPGHGSAIALVSGRPIDDIDRLFAPLRLPAAGQHGFERRDAHGRLHRHQAPARTLASLRALAAALVARHPGVRVEDKGMTVALHYRQAPAAIEPLRDRLAEWIEGQGREFVLQPGKMVFEVKPAGRDKGTAIREFLDETPFRGRTPAFLGDDLTDEHGFAAVNAAGGHSYKVGPGVSCARWRLEDVAAVHDWLAAYLDDDRDTGRSDT